MLQQMERTKLNQPCHPKAIPFQECLAKTYRTEDDLVIQGRTVLNHCQIVGRVARELIKHLPARLKDRWFPPGAELIAASHDTGKISPTFQEKLHRSLSQDTKNSKPELSNSDPEHEKYFGYHGGVSEISVKAMQVGNKIPEIIGKHHGQSPTTCLSGRMVNDSLFGGFNWQQERIALIAALRADLICDFPEITSDLQAEVLAGLTTVSDWIGSNQYFEDPTTPWEPAITTAVESAGFIAPKIKPSLSFSEIFGFPPHETQAIFYQQIYKPGIYILEAPMGIGKTEAALYAAYLALSQQQARGIYFALPTQLTSDKIYDRFEAFLGKILADDSEHRTMLLHSQAWLKQTDYGEEGEPGGSWFSVSKRGLLAPFAVGTIDQALMAVIPSVRHNFVRTFGLLGKVVILDEVHSYDLYTGTLLDELIQQLKSLDCTVIILSATLTTERRQQLLLEENSDSPSNPMNLPYPLISITGQPPIAPPSLQERSVQISLIHQDDLAIEEALTRAEQGCQILWIENTVKEAQAVYKRLSARSETLPIECGLLHSRFLKIDRETHENYWVTQFGKAGHPTRAQRGRILVGTQVMEQSIDIDADFLVTRLSPTDMLLQRIGRLWRHESTPRPLGCTAEAWILTPQLATALSSTSSNAFGKTEFIYAPYVLGRTLEVWSEYNRIRLPSDIRPLLEKTYEEQSFEFGSWHDHYFSKLQSEKNKLRNRAKVSLSHHSSAMPESEETACTRYAEKKTVEILLIKSYNINDAAKTTHITLLSGKTLELPHNPKQCSRQTWRNYAIDLLRNTLRVPENQAPAPVDINALKLGWLARYVYVDKKNEKCLLFRIVQVAEDGLLHTLSQSPAHTEGKETRLFYQSHLGYFIHE